MDYLPLAVGIAFAVFWYRGARVENISTAMWVGPSVAITAIVVFGLGKGWIAVVIGQLAMFIAITLYRIFADKNGGGT